MHTHEQYDLSVYEGAVRWVHHNEYDQQIFSVKTEPIIVKGMEIYENMAITLKNEEWRRLYLS